MSLESMLARGYFPKELPNPFSSRAYAAVVAGAGAALPPDFPPDWAQGNRAIPVAQHAQYSHARNGLQRRLLSVPNPVSQYALSSELFQNWTDLQPIIGGTALSATAPRFATSGRAVQALRPLSQKPALAAETRRNNRYILSTDITRYYHSIYTHSVPWAVHGKAFAKANRQFTHLGNRLDYLIRSAQDQQTVGIPIGPDTSLVISEILMQTCDRELLNQIPGLRGHRYIDDYELGFRTRTQAEDAYHVLDAILSGYELGLNPLKTHVRSLPHGLEREWATRLRQTGFRSDGTPAQQRNDLLGYFDLAFHLAEQHPDQSVLQYAVSRAQGFQVEPSNSQLFFTLLLDCAVPEPACLSYVLKAVTTGVNAGADCPATELEEALNAIVIEHARLPHTSEVAWSLWGCLALSIPLSADATTAIAPVENSFIALLALHMESVGLLGGTLDTAVWESFMTEDALYEDNWLLSYEANVQGWLPSVGGGDHVAADSRFGYLKGQGVSFYDATLAAATAGAPLPVPTVPTGVAIALSLEEDETSAEE